jgi:hypothetical protein
MLVCRHGQKTNYVINEIGRIMVALNLFLGDIISKLALKCWNGHICFRFVVRNERNFIFLMINQIVQIWCLEFFLRVAIVH